MIAAHPFGSLPFQLVLFFREIRQYNNYNNWISIAARRQDDGKKEKTKKNHKLKWFNRRKERTTHQMLFVPICFFSSFSWMRNFVSQLSQRFINSSIYTLNWLPVIYRFPFNSKWTNWHLNLSLEWPRERIRYTDRTPQNKAKYPEWRRL